MPSPIALILTGSIAIDRIMSFDGSFEEAIKPDKLHVLSLSVLLNQVVDTHGGIAANIAYNLAMLGDQPLLLGAVGVNGRDYMAKLQTLGVNTQFIHFSELPTASFTVMTDKNDCQVGGFYPGAMSDEGLASLPEVVATQKNSFIVISAHDPELMARQVRDCNEHNYRLFYDASQQINNLSGHDLQQGVEAAELLILNDYEMEVLQQKTGWSLAELQAKVSTIIVTLGEKGCRIYSQAADGTPIDVAAIPDVKAIDPTGAGDAFRAGFLYGYLRNWSLVESARLGCVVASFAVERKGTQEHQLHWDKVKKRYQTNYEGQPWQK